MRLHGPVSVSEARLEEEKSITGLCPCGLGKLTSVISHIVGVIQGRGAYETVGCTSLRCEARSAGIEYDSVLTVCSPVVLCVKRSKSASSRSLAALTGICTESQSPAKDNAVACSSFSPSHARTAEALSSDGDKYVPTYEESIELC